MVGVPNPTLVRATFTIACLVLFVQITSTIGTTLRATEYGDEEGGERNGSTSDLKGNWETARRRLMTSRPVTQDKELAALLDRRNKRRLHKYNINDPHGHRDCAWTGCNKGGCPGRSGVNPSQIGSLIHARDCRSEYKN